MHCDDDDGDDNDDDDERSYPNFRANKAVVHYLIDC